MSDFSKVASALARRTRDTGKDKSTDLDIAQASHALKILKEIALEEPKQVLSALKMQQTEPVSIDNTLLKTPRTPNRKRRKRCKKRLALMQWRFSTAYSRRG
jgi:hypothetical protein